MLCLKTHSSIQLRIHLYNMRAEPASEVELSKIDKENSWPMGRVTISRKIDCPQTPNRSYLIARMGQTRAGYGDLSSIAKMILPEI